MTIFAFDIDGTICFTNGNDYKNSIPDDVMIAHINLLYEQGHYIKMFTARGCVSKKDWTEFTQIQLANWGLKFHELITNQKPHFDLLIDDKVINISEYKKSILSKRIGIITENFDSISFEYIKNLEETKKNCDFLIVCLESNCDPKILNEKEQILRSIKFIDEVILFSTKENLEEKLKILVSGNQIIYINS